jgi:hypothetical protein
MLLLAAMILDGHTWEVLEGSTNRQSNALGAMLVGVGQNRGKRHVFGTSEGQVAAAGRYYCETKESTMEERMCEKTAGKVRTTASKVEWGCTCTHIGHSRDGRT